MVTKITATHINTGHQNRDFISCSLPQILQMLDFFPQHHPTSMKDMLPFSKSQIFTLSPQLSTLHALFGLGGLL
jgi:hypothetical protein